MASVIIVFGSTSGNTEMVCHKVAEVMRSQKHQVTVQRAELSEIKDIKGHDICILGASTYGHGLLQDHMIPFIKELKKSNLKGQKFAIIGLGDDKYDNHYNVESSPIMQHAVKEVGGEVIHEALEINRSPMWQMIKVEEWAQELSAKI